MDGCLHDIFCQGMKYLSEQRIVHNDLAARNVLVTKDEHMKIFGFRRSRCLPQESDYYTNVENMDLPASWFVCWTV